MELYIEVDINKAINAEVESSKKEHAQVRHHSRCKFLTKEQNEKEQPCEFCWSLPDLPHASPAAFTPTPSRRESTRFVRQCPSQQGSAAGWCAQGPHFRCQPYFNTVTRTQGDWQLPRALVFFFFMAGGAGLPSVLWDAAVPHRTTRSRARPGRQLRRLYRVHPAFWRGQPLGGGRGRPP